MREVNHTVYYTTAQVKDMVELSDQNVRKYVRLLEDREYEVAKDEHNRRLFSQDDVAVLKEFIKLAKKPGYTLETAAEEIIEKVPHIVSAQSGTLPSSVTNNDINRMLGSVMEKLEIMQQENRELKDNVHSLVERLELYSSYNQPLSLEYKEGYEQSEEMQFEKPDADVDNSDMDVSNDATLEQAPEVEENTESAEREEKQKTGNIDMNSYAEAAVNQSDDAYESREDTHEDQQKEKQETGGYFSKLFSMFKSK